MKNRIYTLILLAAGMLFMFWAAPLNAQFVKRIIDGSFLGALSVYGADVDGDGDMDVLGSARNAHDITWWENDGDTPPTFIKHTIDGNFSGALKVHAGDLDGDGDMDVIGTAQYVNGITWWENDGNSPPAFTKRTLTNNISGVGEVHAADLDGDGDMDVIGASSFENNITWWVNDGNSPPAFTKRTIDGNYNYALSVYAADVDGDGNMDVLGSATQAKDITWYESNGNSPPAFTKRTIDGNFGNACTVYAADMDNDGDLDVLGANFDFNDVAWYENNGSSPPGFTKHIIDLNFGGARKIIAADLNGDGDLDVLGVGDVSNDVAWWENNGSSPPTFTKHIIDANFFQTRSVFAADMDGDGDTDVLGAAYFANDIAWYENAPEIQVLGNDLDIVDGDATPRIEDGTDFGTTCGKTQIFRINSLGIAGNDLQLTGMPKVSVSGSSAFSVVMQPAPNTLPGGDGVDVEISFQPTTAGPHTATISIQSNDTDEGTFDFVVKGDMPGQILYVNDDAPGSNTGLSWTDAFADLQSALDLAEICTNITEIWVAAGIYLPTKESDIGDPRSKTFSMLPGVKIYGGFAGGETSLSQRNLTANVTTLSGDIGTPNDNSDNSYHIIYNYDNGLDDSAVLDGFIVTGGNANEFAPHDRGSGVYNYYSSPTVINCSILENSSTFYGGGMFNSYSSPVINNCTFIGNSAKNGGGMHNFHSPSSLTNCSFSGNSATLGGALDNLYSSPNVTNCILWGNTGGEIRNFSIFPTITYSIVKGGYAGTGNLNVDPLFVDAANGNLRLQTCSPAIDAGDDTGIPMGITTDLDGNARQYSSGTVDMGAYELQAPFTFCCPAGNVVFVNKNAMGKNTGENWDDAFTGLQDALDLIASGDCAAVGKIWVAAGTYLPTKELYLGEPRSKTFSMLPGVKIYGGFAGGETSLGQRNWTNNVTTLSGDIGTPGDDSDNCYHIIYNNNNGLDETALLDGFTITGGNADGEFFDEKGGGMLNILDFPIISNCTFSSNKAEEGGGVYNNFRSATFINCLFNENEAIDGGGMYNSSASPTIENCTFSGNMAIDNEGFASDGSGGGMFNLNSSPTVTGCNFIGNTSNSDIGGGGGMFNFSNSEPIITNCIFSENEAISGGGLFNSLASATVENCTFSGNMAEKGGGLRNYNSTASSIVGCTFNENVAENDGGGMDNLGATPTVTNCTFHQNEANIGAGMNNTSSSAVLTNCVFTGNTASFLGGGVNNLGSSSPSFINCTISENSAVDGGGGLANRDCTPVITNCILWGNGSEFEDYMSTPTVTHSIVQGGYTGTGNLDADPLFVDAANGDFRLVNCSPGVDAGDNAAIPMGITTDLDGNSRIYNNETVDMGAYELQAPFSYCCPAGNVVFVNKNATGKNTGETWDDAFTDLQDALDLIASGNCAMVDEIWVAAGTYLPTKKSGGSAERYRTFVMLPDVKIYGGFAGGEMNLNDRDWVANVTTLSGDIGTPGDNSDNCFHVIFNYENGLDATAVLDGFSITAGKTLSDFTPSSITGTGAGMYNYLSSPTISNCFFFGNNATRGGGMCNSGSSPTVYNCTFSINSAEWTGGGMFNLNSSPIIINCSFYGNLTGDEGGGMYNIHSSPAVTNSIFWENEMEITNGINSNPTVTHSIVQGGYPGTGNLDADPHFVDAANGDLRLMQCSPAIDAGDNVAIPMGSTTDLDGNDRILNATGIPTATVDMGAYEYTGSRTITAVCASPTVQLDASGNGSLTATEVGSSSSADCSPLELAIDVTEFTCADIGPNSVELTVTVPGLVGEGKCTATVTVEDNVLPTANCQPYTVELDGTGNASIMASDIDNGSSDACGIASLAVSPNTFDCVNVYTTNTVTLTVTDNNGNVNTCTATVTVEDNENPAPTCKTGTVQLDASGQYSLTENDVFAGGTDNCTTVNFWKTTPTMVSCTDAGTTVPVLVEVFDASGNQASCTANIFVEDAEMPVAICPANIPDVVLDQNGLGTLPANIGDGSSTDNCSATESSPAISFNCNAGPQMVTLTVTDGFNTVTTDCSFNVVDYQVPVAHCPANIPNVQLDENGNGSLPANIGDGSSTDNCSVLETSPALNFTCADIGVQTVVLTASDGANSSTVSCSFNVVDNISPAANCISQTIQVSLNANAQYTLDPNQLDGGSTDACGIQSLSVSPAVLSCQHEGATTVTLTVTDLSGNSSTCTAYVEVADFLTINDVSATAESCAGMGDGSISILASAGGGQLKYSIDGGATFQSGNTFGNLMPGIYNLVVKIFGVPSVCEKTAVATVEAGSTLTTWYKDLDGDGYSDGVTQTSCTQPTGYTDNPLPGTDCNDSDPLAFPSQIWYEDLDGDGYGSGAWSVACQRPAGCFVASELVAVDTDCDDLDATVNPTAIEICDGLDNDCNGETDEDLADTYIGNILFTTQAQLDAWLACYDVIQGSVTIQGGNITDLSPLSNITEITGNLMILMNGILTSLDGLENLTTVGGALFLYYNFQLSDCCAIEGLLSNGGVAGSITIFFNKVGCNSSSEILNVCAPSGNLVALPNGGGTQLAEQAQKERMTIFPNPASGSISVRTRGMEGRPAVLTIANSTGIVVERIVIPSLEGGPVRIDTYRLKDGLYTLTLKAEGAKQVSQRFVKMDSVGTGY